MEINPLLFSSRAYFLQIRPARFFAREAPRRKARFSRGKAKSKIGANESLCAGLLWCPLTCWIVLSLGYSLSKSSSKISSKGIVPFIYFKENSKKL
jgi:hypothetical protein